MVNPAVEAQYKNWVYPIPIDDMEKAIKDGSYWEIGDPNLYWPLMWPRKRGLDQPLTVLCAGCGTNQAAYYACRNPSWEIVGIDLSDESLAHQNFLKQKHNLSNLTLHKLDLNKISSLGKSYDFITCTGVLHHLPSPDDGLLALKDVLKPKGVINLMVYGSSLRLGVYLLQEAFKLIGLEQTVNDVQIVKSVMKTLHPQHVVRRYIENADDLSYDSGIVDTFLHPQDKAYWVKDVYAFTRRAGLEFLNWCDPVEYSLEANIPEAHPLRNKLGHLNAEDAAHVCDLLAQARGTHRWLAAHPDHVKDSIIPFNFDRFFDCIIVPHRMTEVIDASNYSTGKDASCKRGIIPFTVSHQLAEVMAISKGRIPLREAMKSLVQNDAQYVAIKAVIKNDALRLYNSGHVYIVLPEEKP